MNEVVEHKPLRRLELDERVFVRVPEDVVLGVDIGDMRASVYMFFAMRRGIDGCLGFSVNEIYEWTGRDIRNRKGSAKSDIRNAISGLADRGYLSVDESFAESRNTDRVNAWFDTDKVDEECAEQRFAIVYVDEIKKILSYGYDEHVRLNKDAMLLMLSYLRTRIPRRSNKLRIEEIGAGSLAGQSDVDARRNKYPEVYNEHYNNISDEIGLSNVMVSKYSSVLSDVGIIYVETLPRFQLSGRWHTNWMLFCNRYKRDKSSLIADGEKYFEKEIRSKKNLLLNHKRMEKMTRKNTGAASQGC